MKWIQVSISIKCNEKRIDSMIMDVNHGMMVQKVNATNESFCNNKSGTEDIVLLSAWLLLRLFDTFIL